MAKQSYRVESKRKTNKKIAIRLLISLIVIMSVYFGCIKAGAAVVQEIYIWAGFALTVVYVVCAATVAREKLNYAEKNGREALSPRAKKINEWGKLALTLLVPILFSLLIDYMLIVLGIAGYLGI